MSINSRKVYEDANKFIRKGQIDKAIKLLSELVSKDPNEVKAIHDIIKLYSKKGDRGKIIHYSIILAQRYEKQGFYKKSLGALKTALNFDKKNIDIYLNLIEVYKAMNYKGEVANTLKEAIILLDEEKRISDEVKLLKELIELEPNNISVRVKLAEIYAQENKTKDAEREFKIVERELKKQGKLQQLGILLEKKVSFGLGNEEDYENLAEIYLNNQNYAKAIKFLKQLVSHGQLSEKRLLLMYKTLEGLGKTEKVLQVLKQLLSFYYQKKDINKAREIAKKILEYDPGNERAKKILSMESAGVKEREKTEAGKSDEGVSEKDPRSLMTQFVVFVKYNVLGKARAILERILEEDYDIETLCNVAKVCVKFKFKEGAEELYVKAINKSRETGGDGSDKIIQEALTYLPDSERIRSISGIEEEELEMESVEDVQETEFKFSTSAEEFEKTNEKAQEEVEIELSGSEQSSEEEITLESIEKEPELEIEEPAKSEEEIEIEIEEKTPEKSPEIENRMEDTMESKMSEEVKGEGLGEMESKFEKEEDEIVTEEDIREAFNTEELDFGEESPGEMHLSTTEGAPEAETGHQGVQKEEVEEEPLDESLIIDDELSEAEFYITQGLYEEARNVLTKVIEKRPDSEKAVSLLQKLEHLEKAREEIQVEDEKLVIKDDQKTPEFEDSILQGDWDLKEVLNEELEEEPKDTGVSAEPTHQVSAEDVLKEFKKGVKKILGEEECQAHYDLGYAYIEMGLYDEAIEEFMISMKSKELEVSSLLMIGVCYINQSNPESAIEVLQKAWKLSEEDQKIDVEYNMGVAYEMMNQPEKAIEWFEKVMDKNPSFKDISERIEVVKSLVKVEKKGEKGEGDFERLSLEDILGDEYEETQSEILEKTSYKFENTESVKKEESEKSEAKQESDVKSVASPQETESEKAKEKEKSKAGNKKITFV